MDDAELVARLRNIAANYADVLGSIAVGRLREGADRIEALTARLAKAEALAEALRDIGGNTAAVTADFDNYGMCILSVNTTSTAALKAWEKQP